MAAFSTKRGRKLSDDELTATLREFTSTAVNYSADHFSRARMYAERLYEGDKELLPYEKGRSSMMSRDVAEAVDTEMAGLMRIFTSIDTPVRFMATKPGDEELAEQVTDYCNYIWQKNNGFSLYHNFFKSALMFRLGVLKIWWDESVDVRVEEYEDLDDAGYQAIVDDPELEIIEESHYPDPDALEAMEAHIKAVKAQQLVQQAYKADSTEAGDDNEAYDTEAEVKVDPSQVPQLTCVKCHRTKTHAGVKIVPVPPEELLFSQYKTDAEDRQMIGHRRRMSASELREMGVPEKIVDEIDFEPESMGLQQEKYLRHRREMTQSNGTVTANDPSANTTWVSECYCYIDYDGDGVAEFRRITVAGTAGDVIIDNDPVDDHPFAILTPIPMPFKMTGQSLSDVVEDLALMKSTILRQVADNFYANNHTRYIVNSQVHLDDLLSPRPGQPIRVDGKGPPSESVMPLPVQSMAQEGLAFMNYVDSVRENRTGITRHGAGLDADILKSHQSAGAVQSVMDASTQRMELIARNFAETGVKRAMKRILALVRAHQNKEEIIRLRGNWVPIRPAEWNNDFDLTVEVGLGTGNRDTELQRAMSLLPIFQQVVMMQGGPSGPVVTLPNIYQMLQKVIQAAGFRNPELFVTDPRNAPPPQPHQPPPVDPIEQGKLQLAQQQLQEKARQADMKHQVEVGKGVADYQLKQQQMQMQDSWHNSQHELGALKLYHATQADQAGNELAALQLHHQNVDQAQKNGLQALQQFHAIAAKNVDQVIAAHQAATQRKSVNQAPKRGP